MGRTPPVKADDVDISFSIGGGRQYSGLLGAQAPLGTDRIRGNLGFGFLIFSAGVDLVITRHISTGVSAYVGFASASGAGAHLNYHFNSAFSKGFSIGLNITQVTDSDPRDDIDDSKENEVLLSIGYQF